MIHRRYTGEAVRRTGILLVGLLVVQLQIHAVLDLVVFQRDVILVDGVPLLQDQLFVSRSSLSGDQLLQVTNRVIFVALYSDFLAQTVVDDDFQHVRFLSLVKAGWLKKAKMKKQVYYFECELKMKTILRFYGRNTLSSSKLMLFRSSNKEKGD